MAISFRREICNYFQILKYSFSMYAQLSQVYTKIRQKPMDDNLRHSKIFINTCKNEYSLKFFKSVDVIVRFILYNKTLLISYHDSLIFITNKNPRFVPLSLM